ncbi:MFS transporter [Nocardia sp. NPDC059246]|uniref:MFS transporter n=1 Tax=unclassified Nocardia TaxID=2637762 RepID=UPI0036A50A7D
MASKTPAAPNLNPGQVAAETPPDSAVLPIADPFSWSAPCSRQKEEITVTRAEEQRRDRHAHSTSPHPRRSGYAALKSRNFRLYLIGQAVVTTGAWVQRIAQDWLVLTLTGSATAVGITTALQWAPTLVFGLLGGWIADHCPNRRILQTTQTTASMSAAILAGLTLTDHVAAWHVQLLAAVTGTIVAIERPVRQTMITDMVEPDHIHSAISLNYSVYYLGNFAGPAVSGILLAAAGPGWAFTLNSVLYIAPLVALARIDPRRFPAVKPSACQRDEPAEGGLRALVTRPGIWRPLTLCAIYGMFALNLPVILTSQARVLHAGPTGYSVLASSIALGSACGALAAAGRKKPEFPMLVLTGYALSAVLLLAAVIPPLWDLAGALVLIGAVSTTLFTGTNSYAQLNAGRRHRGQVTGIYNMAETGSAALGGPVVGIIVETLGPRAGWALAGVIPGAALLLLTVSGFAHRTAAVPPTDPHSRQRLDDDAAGPRPPCGTDPHHTSGSPQPPLGSDLDTLASAHGCIPRTHGNVPQQQRPALRSRPTTEGRWAPLSKRADARQSAQQPSRTCLHQHCGGSSRPPKAQSGT